MRILGVQVTGLKGLRDGHHSFVDGGGSPLDTVLITGDGGSGKTRLLEAIIAAKEAIGAWGSTGRLARLRRPDVPRATIIARWLLSESERAEAGLESGEHETECILDDRGAACSGSPPGLARVFRSHHEAGLARFGYLHADRYLPDYASDEPRPFMALGADNRKFAHLLKAAALSLREEQVDAARMLAEGELPLPGARSRLTDMRESLRPLLPRHALISAVLEDAPDLIFQTMGDERVRASEMSASERQALLLALDALMSHRRTGIILLDGPELQRHPAEHVQFFNAYRELVDASQLIAATSSAALLRSAEHVIRLQPWREP